MIVGFSVSLPKAIETLAAQNNVPISLSNVIYRLMDDIKNRIIALLPVIVETRVTGEAVVLRLFDIQLKAKQTKKVAGCRVTNGLIEKNKFARLMRDGVTVHDGMLFSRKITLRMHECLHRTVGHYADLKKGRRRGTQRDRMWPLLRDGLRRDAGRRCHSGLREDRKVRHIIIRPGVIVGSLEAYINIYSFSRNLQCRTATF